MPTRRPTRNTIRDHFDLGRRRWTTIARDPRFRSLLAPEDTPHALPSILTHLYGLRDDPRRANAYRRHLQDVARAQRAAFRNRQREHREQEQRLAPAARLLQRSQRRRQQWSELQHARQPLDHFTDSRRTNQQGDTTHTFTWQLVPPIYLFESMEYMSSARMLTSSTSWYKPDGSTIIL